MPMLNNFNCIPGNKSKNRFQVGYQSLRSSNGGSEVSVNARSSK